MKPLFENSSEGLDLSQDKGRWLILSLLFLTTFGSLFAYDTLGVLQENVAADLKTSEFGLSILYNITVIPNIILPLLSGFIIDRFGVRLTFLVFTILVAFGQLLICLGISHSSFSLVLLGRFVFGLGYHSQYVSKSVLISRWADKSEMSFALSLSLFLSKLGTEFNVLASPSLVKSLSLSAPFYLGFILTLLQIILVCVVNFADRRTHTTQNPFFRYNEEINLQDTFTFVKPFYILCVGCALSSGIFSAFLVEGSDLLTKRFSLDKDEARNVLNILLGVSIFTLPVFGWISDKIEKKLYVLPIYALLFMIAAFDLVYQPESSRFGVIKNLIFYALFYSSSSAILWACIPLVSGSNKVGIASGVAISVVEIFLFILPLLSNWIIAGTSATQFGYFYTHLFYGFVGIIVLGLMIWVIIEDRRIDNFLNRRAKDGKRIPKAALEMSTKEKFMIFENEDTLSSSP